MYRVVKRNPKTQITTRRPHVAWLIGFTGVDKNICVDGGTFGCSRCSILNRSPWFTPTPIAVFDTAVAMSDSMAAMQRGRAQKQKDAAISRPLGYRSHLVDLTFFALVECGS